MEYKVRITLIKLIVASGINLDKVIIEDNTKLFEDLGFNSISIVNLIVLVEETFSISFSDQDNLIEIFDSIGSIVSYVIGYLNNEKYN